MSLNLLKQEATSHNTSLQRLRELAAINNELARLVATNPFTGSSLLRELALKAIADKDIELQRVITSNANAPKQCLIWLANQFPEEFFSNPAYDSSILKNLKFIASYEKKLLLKLVCVSNTSSSFLEFAADICKSNIERVKKKQYFENFSLEQQYGIKYLQMNINYLSHFSFEEFWKWREILIAVASHQNSSRKQLLDLSQSGENIVTEVARLRLDYPHDNLSFWDKVVSSKKPNIIPFIPHRLMFQLAQLPEISINFLKQDIINLGFGSKDSQ